MGPDAYNVICDKVSPVNSNEMPYTDIRELKSRYNPESLEIAENFRFLNRKHNDSGSAQKYPNALQ